LEFPRISGSAGILICGIISVTEVTIDLELLEGPNILDEFDVFDDLLFPKDIPTTPAKITTNSIIKPEYCFIKSVTMDAVYS
jgi:hypothetical protein